MERISKFDTYTSLSNQLAFEKKYITIRNKTKSEPAVSHELATYREISPIFVPSKF